MNTIRRLVSRRHGVHPVLLVGVVFFCVSLLSYRCYAVDPTDLEAANDLDPGMLKIGEQLSYDHYHPYSLEAESSIEYDFSEHVGLEVTVPVEKDGRRSLRWDEVRLRVRYMFESDSEVWGRRSSHVGDAGLRLKYVFNPDADGVPVVAASLKTEFPTGRGSKGIDEEARLFLSQRLGTSDREHQLHLTIAGTFVSSNRDEERRARYEAIFGYSCKLRSDTTFVVDFVREQLERKWANSNVVEVGLKHEFNDTISVAGSMGHGIGEESPDWRARLGLELKFGLTGK